MHKSIARTLLVGGVVFTSLVGQVGAVVTDPRDISDSKFREHIENLIAGNVVSGYSDGTFRPSDPVTRGQMAKFIVNGFNLGADGNIQQFGDVPSTNPFFAYINILKTEGIISGYSDGTYRPNAYVTRGETAKFIHNALKRSGVQGTEVGSGVTSDFPDVTGSNVFKDSIIYLSREKIINGFSDGTFKPNNNVTRGEMAKMVDGARGLVMLDKVFDVGEYSIQLEVPSSWTVEQELAKGDVKFYVNQGERRAGSAIFNLSSQKPATLVSNTSDHLVSQNGNLPMITHGVLSFYYNGLDKSEAAINGVNYPVAKYYTEESFDQFSFANFGQYIIDLESDLYISSIWGNGFVMVCDSDGDTSCGSRWNPIHGTSSKDLENLWKVIESIKF
jgi:hypothetical protein